MIQPDQSQQPRLHASLKSEVMRVAKSAIQERLGPAYVADYGLAGCLRDVHKVNDRTLAVHLNSAGNAAAVSAALQRAGYTVSAGIDTDYGVVLMVKDREATRPGCV